MSRQRSHRGSRSHRRSQMRELRKMRKELAIWCMLAKSKCWRMWSRKTSFDTYRIRARARFPTQFCWESCRKTLLNRTAQGASAHPCQPKPWFDQRPGGKRNVPLPAQRFFEAPESAPHRLWAKKISFSRSAPLRRLKYQILMRKPMIHATDCFKTDARATSRI